MNKELLTVIVKHVFANLGIYESFHVNKELTKSLTEKEFLLSEKIKFELEDGTILSKKIWGCQLSIEPQDIKILLADCSQDDITEFAVLVQLKNAPAYGLYLADSLDNQALLACSIKDSNNWLECGTYLQATFLAGMEQIKDVGYSWSKCQDYQSQYQLLKSFIDYHSSLFKEENEGQED